MKSQNKNSSAMELHQLALNKIRDAKLIYQNINTADDDFHPMQNPQEEIAAEIREIMKLANLSLSDLIQEEESK